MDCYTFSIGQSRYWRWYLIALYAIAAMVAVKYKESLFAWLPNGFGVLIFAILLTSAWYLDHQKWSSSARVSAIKLLDGEWFLCDGDDYRQTPLYLYARLPILLIVSYVDTQGKTKKMYLWRDSIHRMQWSELVALLEVFH